MKQVFLEITARIDAMQLRERALLLLAATVVLFFLVDTLGLRPVFRQQQQIKTDIADLGQQIQVLRERSGLLSGESTRDPITWRNTLHTELAELENRLHLELGGMLAPDQAIDVLEQVLAEEQELKLLVVDAVSKPLNDIENTQQGIAAATGIGRYGLQLQLQGSYLATLRYLLALEALPWQFFWEGVNFEVTDYPNARVTLDIYTLGLLEG